MQAPEKIKQLIDLLQDKEVQSFLKLFIDNSIVTSDLNILKRLSTIESMLGLNEIEEEEDHAPNLPEKISALEETVKSLSGAPIKQPDDIPTGKTEIRACKLVERLKQARETAGNKFLSSCDIVQFLKHGIDEKFRVKEGQNVRQVKKEVLEKAARMYPDIFISQKSTGRRDLRLVLKA